MTSKAQVLGPYHSPMTWVLIFPPTPHMYVVQLLCFLVVLRIP